MKKIIVSFALFISLLPLGVYGAGVCEIKCCGATENCQNPDAFCKENKFPGLNVTTDDTYSRPLSNCLLSEAGSCSTYTETPICCCIEKKSNPTDSVLTVSSEVTSLNFTPEVSIPGSVFNNGTAIAVGTPIEKNNGTIKTVSMDSDLLGKYIQALYNYSLAIVAILAAIVLMGGGLLWLTSGGDSGQITKAKEMIIGSITGLTILFCAWIILNTVNPELLKLKPISTIVINKIQMGCCEENGVARMTMGSSCKGNFDQTKILNSSGQCESTICCIDQVSIYDETAKDKSRVYNNCYASTKSNCPFLNHQYNWKCSDIDRCVGLNGGVANCDNVKDGSKPNNSQSFNSDSQYCYNNLIYPSLGQSGEPCGIEAFSKCDEDKEQNGKSCVGGKDGRGCFKGLYCCQFKSDGTRINKT